MDVIDIARYVGALMLVLALVGFAALAARRFGLPGWTTGTVSRRLGVVETLMIDARHKIYLLRRDDREHLVLVGPAGASVVESAIPAVATPTVSPLQDGLRR
jgi:flagellar protein FliO/FliZ